MKRTLTLMALALIPVSVMAQLTLNQSSYTGWTAGTDTLKLLNGQPQMATGANATWDLSGLNYNTGVYPSVYVAGTNPALPNASFYLNLPFSLAQSVTYNVKAWEGIVSTGLLSYGESMDHQMIDLSTLTDPGDSLVFPAQSVPYTTPRTIIKFPANYNDNWGSSFRSVTNFNATIATMFLNNTPAQRVTNTVQKDTVTGWGKIRVRNTNGTPSAYMNVLQVRTRIVQSDSFYLNGIPVDNSLLANLMLSQGMMTELFMVNYYRTGEVTPVVQVEYSDGSFTQPSNTYMHLNRLPDGTGIADIADNNGVSICPNPVKNGQVNINIAKNVSGEWTYQLTNVMGQTVSAGRLNLNNGKATLNTGAASTTGIYYLQLNRNNEKVSLKALSIE